MPSQLLTLGLDPPYTPTEFITAPEMQLGAGVAAGDLGGGAAADLVAVSDTALHVYVDGSASADLSHADGGPGDPCPLAPPSALLGSDWTNRAVVVGRLLGSGVQIAVGTPNTTGAGTVSIFTVDVATQTFTCAQTLKPPAGAPANPLFGRALATGDFDHDGQLDLLVGSPPSAVYLYRGPITAAPTKTLANPNPLGDGIGDFGKALAAFDLDGKPGDEALIGDPARPWTATAAPATCMSIPGRCWKQRSPPRWPPTIPRPATATEAPSTACASVPPPPTEVLRASARPCP